MTNIPNFVRDRLKTQPSASDHPDANVLTAFSEHALVDPERAQVLAHLAQCADCRDVLALALPPVEAQSAPASLAPSNSWLRWPVLRWASLAACIVVVAAAALLLQNKPPAAMHSEADVVLPAAPATPKEKDEALASADKVSSDKVSSEADLKLVQPEARETRKGGVVANKIGSRPAQSEQSKDLAFTARSNETAVPTPGVYDSLDRQAPARVSGLNLRRDADLAPIPKPAPVLGGRVAANGQSSAMGRMVVAQAQSAPAANPAPPAASQAVEVSGEAVAVAENAPAAVSPGKAKAGSAAQLQTPEADSAPLAKKELAETDTKISVLAAGSRWALSSQGQLQRSTDDGNTWQPVPVVENVTFRALSAFGNNIWAGGLAGVLYHSSDAGTHWTQVRPASNGIALTGDIVSLQFSDPQHGHLSTSTHESWATPDAGRTWLKTN